MDGNSDRHSYDSEENHSIDEDTIFGWIHEEPQIPIIFHPNMIQISRDLVRRKYFEAFNFYFSKPINEILANLALPHVILYKDFLYLDDESEYLKRYYRLDEVPPRMENLSKFYNNSTEGMVKPNLAVHEQNKIIQKRNHKLHKYYLAHIHDFAQIPQTQRNREDDNNYKRILPNPHEDDGYSDVNYTSEIKSIQRIEDRYEDGPEEGEPVHNSFQQMLERYENGTAKLSFESQQHNVYDPSYSSEGQNSREKTLEDNISFDRSLEIYHQNHRDLFGKDDVIYSHPGESEDHIPHNISGFAISDTSELNLLNEIVTNSKGDKFVPKITNDLLSGIVLNNQEQHRKAVNLKENIDNTKNKPKQTILEKKVNIQIKQIASKQPVHKQTDSISRKSTEKFRAPKENENLNLNLYVSEYIPDRQPKSTERRNNKEYNIDKTGTYAYATSRRPTGQDGVIETSADNSSRNLDFFDRVHTTQQYSTLPNQKDVLNSKPLPQPIKQTLLNHENRQFNNEKSRKSAPHPIKKASNGSTASFKKLSIPGDTRSNTEKSIGLTTSNQSLKGLGPKINDLSKFTEEVNSTKAKEREDKLRKTDLLSKYRVNIESQTDKIQNLDNLYASTDLYNKMPTKSEQRTHHTSRSKTEDALLRDIALLRSKKSSRVSPPKGLDSNPTSARRVVVSPVDPRKERIPSRFASNEGISPKIFTSNNNKLVTQLSSDNSRINIDHCPEDKIQIANISSTNAANGFKSIKIEKVFAYKRDRMKSPTKVNTVKNEPSNSNTSNTRRLTAAHTYSGTSSVEKNDLIISVPVSPKKRRFDLKLNLNRLNQAPLKYNNETHTENSYGFLTSRSSKTGPEEEFKQFKKGGGLTEDRPKNDSSKKEYLLKKNYEPYAEAKKNKTNKKTGSFTNTITGTTPGLKSREPDLLRNNKLLKSAAYDADNHLGFMHQINGIHSAGKPPDVRNGHPVSESYAIKNETRRFSKKIH